MRELKKRKKGRKEKKVKREFSLLKRIEGVGEKKG